MDPHLLERALVQQQPRRSGGTYASYEEGQKGHQVQTDDEEQNGEKEAG